MNTTPERTRPLLHRLIPGEAIDPSPQRQRVRLPRPVPRQARRQPWYHGTDHLGYVLAWTAAATALLTVTVLAAARPLDAPAPTAPSTSTAPSSTSSTAFMSD